jgi:hypothetical protein
MCALKHRVLPSENLETLLLILTCGSGIQRFRPTAVSSKYRADLVSVLTIYPSRLMVSQYDLEMHRSGRIMQTLSILKKIAHYTTSIIIVLY